jgi:hypothetical protein
MVVKRSVTIIFVRVTLQKIIINTDMSNVNYKKIVVTYYSKGFNIILSLLSWSVLIRRVNTTLER